MQTNNPVIGFLVGTALVVGIVVGALAINEKITAKCVDWWPLGGKTCVVGVK